MAIRLSGLTSGLDTDAIVQELVSAHSLKTEKFEKEQTKLTWKQDAWKSLNTKIYSLYTNASNMRLQGTYSLRKTSVSDNTKATVTANSDAVTGTQKLNILQTAQASYITGAKLEGTNPETEVTEKTKLSELGYTGGNTSFYVEGKDGKEKEIKITKTTTIKEVVDQLKEAGVNASFDATNKRIFVSSKESGAKNDFNLAASDANGNAALAALGLNTALVDADGNFINGAEKYKDAYVLFRNAQAAGQTVEEFIRAQMEDYKQIDKDIKAKEAEKAPYQETIADYRKLLEQNSARKAHNAIYAELQGLVDKAAPDGSRVGLKSSQLRDLVSDVYKDGAITEEEVKNHIASLVDAGSLAIPDEKSVEDYAADVYNVLKDQTENMAQVAAYTKNHNDLISKSPAELAQAIEDAKPAFQEASNAIDAIDAEIETLKQEKKDHPYGYLVKDYDVTKENGQAKQDAEIARLAKEAEEANRIMTTDAYKADPDGNFAVKITGQDAIITLNDVTFTSATNSFSINGLSINAQAVTGAGAENSISITTTVDTQGIYDKIKDFLTEYNNVINEMTKLYNAESARDYEPLTDEEREAMSEEQIEKWEDKIKSALLRRDGNLNSVMSAMINSMSQSYEVNGQKLSLGSFGISTMGFLNSAENEQYAFHIDGDEDDENTSGKKDKLMAAIEKDPDQLMDFMTQLMGNLYSSIDEKMKSTELSSAYKVYNDKELDKESKRITEQIAKWEEKIREKEDYYYDKFSAMEVALSKLQNQTNSLAGLFGTGQ